MAQRMTPTYDRILLKREHVRESSGGIIIPDTAETRSHNAVVKAVGRGKRMANGSIAEPIVKVGDRVIFDKNRGFPVSVDGEPHVIVYEDDLLAVLDS